MNAKTTYFFCLFVLCLAAGRSFAFTLEAESDHMSIEKNLLFCFSSMETKSDGVYVIPIAKRDREIPVRLDGVTSKSSVAAESYFLPYGHKIDFLWAKDFGISFFPHPERKEGFLIRTATEGRSAGLPLKKTYGVLVRKKAADADGKTYEIIDANFDENGTPLPYELKISTRLDESGRPFYATNVISGDSTQRDQKLTQKQAVAEASNSSTHSNILTQSNIDVVLANTHLVKMSEESSASKSSNPWKLVFLIIAVLLVGTLSFCKLSLTLLVQTC